MEYIENKELEEKEIKGIFTDMIKYAPSKLCGMLGNVITVPIYTSLFSQEQYGLYTISIAMLSFLCIIFSDWVGLSGLRFFRHHQISEDLPKYLTTLVTILTINMILMFGISFIFKDNLYSFFHVPFKYFLSVLLLIIPVAIRALLSQILRAQLKSVSYSLTTILNQFATILLAVFFAKYFELGAASILLAMGVSISLIDILLLYQSEILKVFKFQKIEWKFILPIMKYGIPIAATSLSAWIITQSNKFIMNSISGFSKAALVGVGYGLTLPILMTLFAMITVAVIPRVYNLYEAKVDVRPVISKFLGYYILVALPVITIMSIYCVDYTQMFVANPKMYEAYKLVPYFAYGVFFLAMTDYTTLQYHLANKTHIEFTIKVISGIIGVILNFVLIPKFGLIGVGIATFAANFLYFLLSVVIVLPNLNIKFPKYTSLKMLISALPIGCIIYILRIYNLHTSAKTEMIGLLGLFYLLYYVSTKKLIKKYD
ncbi:MAG: polysaccharide biosynthesis C-terminal domain-containing protein [Muribaculaceae bacterium]|nr:polysaccharide biosynthesis C-terminal domain-containing protein [Muribaculaceae bacterium]